MDLKLDKFNVRDATLRSLLALANEFGIKDPTKEQMEKLQDISDALENRVQDEIDKHLKNFAPAAQEEEMYPAASDEDVFLNMEHDEVVQVIHKGVVFGRFCNEPVHFDHELGKGTTCIKQWAHINPEHEDSEGRLRL
jgi:hypothetical protein